MQCCTCRLLHCVLSCLLQAHTPSTVEEQLIAYDAPHERRRKLQMERLLNRYACLPICLTVCLSDCLSVCLPVCLSVYLSVFLSVCLSVCLSEQCCSLFRSREQVDEEEMLVSELKKIDMRKKERERKQQDLQKLISAAEQNAER